jgi:phosphoglycolate phosphatase
MESSVPTPLPGAIVFDFDYTLADSSNPVVDCFRYAFARLELDPPDPDAVRRTIGLSLPRSFEILSGRREEKLVRRFRELFVERADVVMETQTTLLPDTPAVIDLLRKNSIRLAIVSTKYRYRIERILSRYRLTDRFEVVIGGEDVRAMKPDPQGLLLALDKLGCRPGEALYVGDHPVDAEAAQQAGVPFLAVLTGTHPARAFDPFPTRAILAGIAALPEQLGFPTPR